MIKIKRPNGKIVEAEDIDFKPIKEDWNVYELEDGRILKIKVVVARVLRTEEKDTFTGEPIYIVRSQNVLTVVPPKKIKEESEKHE